MIRAGGVLRRFQPAEDGWRESSVFGMEELFSVPAGFEAGQFWRSNEGNEARQYLVNTKEPTGDFLKACFERFSMRLHS